MLGAPEQLDIFGYRARRLAEINRVAADAARVAYNFPTSIRDERVRFYLAEAERYEALAAECTPPARRTAQSMPEARDGRPPALEQPSLPREKHHHSLQQPRRKPDAKGGPHGR